MDQQPRGERVQFANRIAVHSVRDRGECEFQLQETIDSCLVRRSNLQRHN